MTARTPQEALERLSREALAARFPNGVPDDYRSLLEHELKLVGSLGYAPYFLTVNSIVAYARSQEIYARAGGARPIR
jgi:error-prone DNA polymerase